MHINSRYRKANIRVSDLVEELTVSSEDFESVGVQLILFGSAYIARPHGNKDPNYANYGPEDIAKILKKGFLIKVIGKQKGQPGPFKHIKTFVNDVFAALLLSKFSDDSHFDSEHLRVQSIHLKASLEELVNSEKEHIPFKMFDSGDINVNEHDEDPTL